MSRILHLIHIRWWNASAQYAADLAAAQKRLGHETAILTGTQCLAAQKAKALGVTVFERRLTWPYFLNDQHYLAKLARGYDIINAHQADVQNMALMTIARSGPLVVRTRVDVREVKGGALTRYLYNKRLPAIIVPGQNSKTAYTERLGIDPERVHVVYGGVDTERFNPDAQRRAQGRARLGLQPQQVAFGLVGRLGRIKDPQLYVAAAREVIRQHPQAVFFVAGREVEPGLEAQCRELAGEELGRGIRFLGFVDDVPELLAALDIGVITSAGSEAHCRVGLEMMSAGLPVVGADVGVIPEVVKHGETGYIVRSRQSQDWAAVMTGLVSNSELRLQLSRQARSRALTMFNYQKWVAATDEVYRAAELVRSKQWT